MRRGGALDPPYPRPTPHAQGQRLLVALMAPAPALGTSGGGLLLAQAMVAMGRGGGMAGGRLCCELF